MIIAACILYALFSAPATVLARLPITWPTDGSICSCQLSKISWRACQWHHQQVMVAYSCHLLPPFSNVSWDSWPASFHLLILWCHRTSCQSDYMAEEKCPAVSRWILCCCFHLRRAQWMAVYPETGVRPRLFPLISGLSVEISENPTKRFAYFHWFSLMW